LPAFFMQKTRGWKAMATVYLEIDISDLDEEISRLRSVMQPKQFENAMYGIFRRTTRHVRVILKKDLPQQYHVRKSDIQAAVSTGKVVNSPGAGVGCTIPIKAERGDVGGKFRARGGARGWESLHKKYRVQARVVKGGISTLPAKMPGNYGGNPPFRNLSAESLHGLTYTRKTRKRIPIMKVESIAIPQMPMTRSEPDVQRDIRQYLEKQMEQRFNYLVMSGR